MRRRLYRWVLSTSLLGALLSACGDADHSPPPADSPPIDQSHCLKIAEESFDFGAVMASCGSRDRAVTVLNRCSAPVSFSPSLSAGLASAFRLVVPSSRIEVPAQGWSQFQIHFMPSAPGEFTGAMMVRNAQQELSVAVTGQSLDSAQSQVDEWRIPKRRAAVDFLFVIDNSLAMAGRENSLELNFNAVLRDIQGMGYDYHIAVTTTDDSATGEQGRFLPLDDSEPRVLTEETPDVEELFARRVQVGTNGSMNPAGLEAMQRALDPAMLAGHNSGFLRDGAFLQVIVVSASGDNSPDSFNHYYSSLVAVKGYYRVNRMSFSAVVKSTDQLTDFYAQMSNRCGGITTSIDRADWVKSLFAISSDGSVPRIPYRLSSIPSDPSAIRASIDGIEFPSRQGNITNWWYEPRSNSAVFYSIAAPEPGMLLRIEYPIGCVATE